jgi:hypothetical protein
MARKRPVKNRPKTGQKRDPQGRFLPGTAAGPGRPSNPFARQMAALKVGFSEALTAEDMAAVAKKLLELTLGGDIGAAKLLLAALVGPPLPVHPDRLNADEMETRRLQPTRLQELLLAVERDEAPDSFAVEDNEEDLNADPEKDSAAELAQTPERQEPNTAASGWELFAETRLEMDEDSACQLDFLWSKYTYWCADQGFPLLTETAICAWLSERGVVVKTSPYGLPGAARGVRVMD